MTQKPPRLILFLKEPKLGRVKTRLAASIGGVAATNWYRHQVNALIRRLGHDPRWRTEIAISPDRAAASRTPAGRIRRYGQGGGDLGDRMMRALRADDGPAILIGGDIPGVRPAHIADAFRALSAADAVFGPAMDGGFWLVGLSHPRRIPANIFQGTRWSSAETLADARAALGGRRIAEARRLTDVDTAADLIAASQTM